LPGLDAAMRQRERERESQREKERKGGSGSSPPRDVYKSKDEFLQVGED